MWATNSHPIKPKSQGGQNQQIQKPMPRHMC